MTAHVRRTPAQAREAVYWRQGGICMACHTGMRPDEMHLHHRLRRRELDADALWCTCVLVGLHPDCHVVAPQAVHQRPAWARSWGLILRMGEDPRIVPVKGPWNDELLDCDGLARFT